MAWFVAPAWDGAPPRWCRCRSRRGRSSHRAAERDRLGAHRHAAEIGVEIDPGHRPVRRACAAPRRPPASRCDNAARIVLARATSISVLSTLAQHRPVSTCRQLLQPEPDQPRRVRRLAGAARGRRDRGRRLRLTIAEIDQRRDRVGDRLRRAPLLDRAGRAAPPPDRRPHRPAPCPCSSVTMRSATLGPTPGVRATIALSRMRDGGGEVGGLERAEHRERDLGADALHGLQQAEPFALDVGEEAEQPDLVLAHMGLDRRASPARPVAGSACSVRAEQCTR